VGCLGGGGWVARLLLSPYPLGEESGSIAVYARSILRMGGGLGECQELTMIALASHSFLSHSTGVSQEGKRSISYLRVSEGHKLSSLQVCLNRVSYCRIITLSLTIHSLGRL
jgi:hypothetical protein